MCWQWALMLAYGTLMVGISWSLAAGCSNPHHDRFFGKVLEATTIRPICERKSVV
jgi:hypothetical protein